MPMSDALCAKCVLPRHKDGIALDDRGICGACADVSRGRRRAEPAESDFLRIVEKSRGKAKYDCLVMCSGGKDSTAALYYVKKRYKLNPLAFTFDNGFEDPGAIANVRQAVTTLSVDWVYSRSGFMHDMYAQWVMTRQVFPVCFLCSLWYMRAVYETAAAYGIRLIVGGWTRGQTDENKAALGILSAGIREFVLRMRGNFPHYRDFPDSMDTLRKQVKSSGRAVLVSCHWFLPFTDDEYAGVIRNDLGWKPISLSYPRNSTNCGINFLCSRLAVRRGAFTHFHVEKSSLIRKGMLTRDEALRQLEAGNGNGPESDLCLRVLRRLGCPEEMLWE